MAGFVKAFGVSFEYAMHEISYENLALYNATLPSYGNMKNEKDKGKLGTKDKPIKADDPKNRDLVRSIIRGERF